MKTIQTIVISLGILLVAPQMVAALSFAPDTIFLEADTKKECEAIGGNFIEWYEEIYCTKSPDQEPAPDYIGLTVPEARELAEDNGVPFRVVEIDGIGQPVTADWRPGRINASTKNNIVVSYSIEGGEEVVEKPIKEIVEEQPIVGKEEETEEELTWIAKFLSWLFFWN